MFSTRTTFFALSLGTTLTALLALRCGGAPDPDAIAVAASHHRPPVDGGASHDAGSSQDAGSSPDAGGHSDGGATDAGSPMDAGSPADAGSPPPGGLSLRVVGNHLVDASNSVVRLLGVDRSGSEFECIQGGSPGALGWGIFDGPTDLASAQAIASWHANAVRIPLNEDCWLGINGVSPTYGGATYRAAIEGYVATLHQAGLYVIVDLHWSSPGAIPAASQQPMPDADHAVDFWTSVASAFANDQAVVFDLYNEPFLYGTYLLDATQDPWDCWLNGCGINQYLTGGSPYTLPLAWNAVGMQPLVNAVRATGAKNPIMVGGLDWANDLSGWLTHRPQDPEGAIVASWHSYPGEGCSDASCWASAVAPVSAAVPVVTGEVGDHVCTAPAYVPTLLPWADSVGLSYLGWTWNTWGDCDNVLIADYTGTPTANYGQAFKTQLLSEP